MCRRNNVRNPVRKISCCSRVIDLPKILSNSSPIYSLVSFFGSVLGYCMGEFYFEKFVFKSFLTLTNILPYISPNSFSRKFLLRTYFTLTNTRNDTNECSGKLWENNNWNNTLTNTEKEYRGPL